jgi:hypothetical protein
MGMVFPARIDMRLLKSSVAAQIIAKSRSYGECDSEPFDARRAIDGESQPGIEVKSAHRVDAAFGGHIEVTRQANPCLPLSMESNMLKTIACSALLVAGATSLPACAELWNFQYTGFDRIEENTDLGFQPDSFSGNFRGLDGDHNGLLDYSEVSRFTWHGTEYAKNSLPHPGCSYDACKLNSFSFNLATLQLQFSANWNFTDQFGGGEGSLVAGNHYDEYFYTDIGHYTRWEWTDQTQFTISAIPEPSRVAMSAAALLLVVRLRRRGRRPARSAAFS